MIDQKTAAEGCGYINAAILELLEDAAGSCLTLPRNGFQKRMQLATLASYGRDISALATAAVVLSRRSGE